MNQKLKNWVAELRIPFLTGTVVSIMLGSAIAWVREQAFHPGYFLLVLAGGMLLHLGANVVNDYFDHRSGNDEVNREFIRPFSGGSRMIQLGSLTPKEVLSGAILLYTAATAIGLYLAWTRGGFVLVLALVGVFSGVLYTSPGFNLVRMGVGEIFVGVNFGALLTLGAYYVQTQTLTFEPLIASIPVSLLITAVLYINEFPDYHADRFTGKNTIVVRLRHAKAAYGYALIVLSAYTFICINVLSNVTPQLTLLALIPLPLALAAIRRAFRYHSDSTKLGRANALTIVFHFLSSLLISCGYLAYGFLATTISVGLYLVMVVVLLCTLTTILFFQKGKGAPN